MSADGKPDTATGDPDLDRMINDPAVRVVANLYGERVGCHTEHSALNSCSCMMVGLEVLKKAERCNQFKAMWNERIRLWGLLREARDTRAADIVPNGWAKRVDEELRHG